MNDLAIIRKRLDLLEQRIAALEGKSYEHQRLGPRPFVYPREPEDTDDARCSVCNGRYKDMTHYVCSNERCPSAIRCTS